MYQPVTVVTPQGQVVTQALSPGTIRIQNSQVCFMGFTDSILGSNKSHWFKRSDLNLTRCQNELYANTHTHNN